MLQRKTVTLVEDYTYISKLDGAVNTPPTVLDTDSEDVAAAKAVALEAF